MFVSIEDAEGFLEFSGGGVPKTNGKIADLFCLYWGGGPGCGFWSFDPDTNRWKSEGTRYSWQKPEPAGLVPEQREPFKKAMQSLDELATPELPEDPTLFQRDKPFLYEGFVFQWLFIPELGRWEMLPLGSYDAGAAKN